MPAPQQEGYAVSSSQTGIEDGASNLLNGNDTFSQSSAVSYEQIFSPLEIKKDLQGATPGFKEPFAANNSDGIFDNGHVGPTLRELNPYFTTMFGDEGEDFIENNDYIMVANETGGTSDDLNVRRLEDEHSNEPGQKRRDIDTVRVVGLRGPLILSGWGFDIADRPVPKKGDSGDEIFEFKPELVSNRSYWKTGPVHLMWDEERQVWAGGLQMVCGRLVENISPPTTIDTPTYFDVDVLRPAQVTPTTDSATPPVTTNDLRSVNERITCTNRDTSLTQANVTDGNRGDSLVWVVAVRINYEWIPLWVGCPRGAD